jgi:hypothetical protein
MFFIMENTTIASKYLILNKENKFRAAIITCNSEINSLQICNIYAVNHRYLFKGREKINRQVCPYLFQLLFTRRLSVAPSFVPSPRFLDTEYLAFTAEVRPKLHEKTGHFSATINTIVVGSADRPSKGTYMSPAPLHIHHVKRIHGM